MTLEIRLSLKDSNLKKKLFFFQLKEALQFGTNSKTIKVEHYDAISTEVFFEAGIAL